MKRLLNLGLSVACILFGCSGSAPRAGAVTPEATPPEVTPSEVTLLPEVTPLEAAPPGARVETLGKELCVVLSVGSEKGLAHIGVLTALRERGIPVSCVVGTSMGALVGGMYAARPDEDLARQYQSLFLDYEAESRRAAGPLGVALLLGFNVQDWQRLKGVLTKRFAGQRIESLGIDFATQYQVATDSGVRMESVRGGILADEIASSIANPLLFPDIKIERGRAIDPGSDRVSAIPLEAACEAFPDRQFLVSNVTGQTIRAEAVQCPYQELIPSEVEVDRGLALRGRDPHFRALVGSGFRAAMAEVDWGVLPKGAPVPRRALEFVHTVVSVSVSKTKESGKPWDATNSEPDPKISAKLVPCEGCDPYGTSAGELISRSFESQFEFELDLGVVALRKGFELEIEIIDEDFSDDDPISKLSLVFEGADSIVRAKTAQAVVSLSFSER